MGGSRPEFQSVVSGLYEAAAVSHMWPQALEGLARLTGSRGALITRPDRRHHGLMSSPGLADTIAQFFEQGWQNDDLRSARMSDVPFTTDFVRDQDITTHEERTSSSYYRDFARSAGVPWFAACGIVERRQARIGVSIQRSAAEGEFSDADAARMRRIAPHVFAAMHISRRVADQANAERLDALEQMGVAALALDTHGRLRALNAQAEALMGQVLQTAGRRVHALDPGARPALDLLVAAACLRAGQYAAEPPPPPTPLTARDGATWLAHAIPLTGAAQRLGNARALLTLSRLPAVQAPTPETLAAAYDLTPTEARIAHLLSGGLEPAEIAERLGVTLGAVRFHLKAILPKAGVRRQAAFVAAVAGLKRR
jgi:DNA-binding CsgD family transcriptional regulator